MTQVHFENAVSVQPAPRWIHRLLVAVSVIVVVIAALANIGKQHDGPTDAERQASMHRAPDR